MNKFTNEALLIQCGDSELVGIVTVPEKPRKVGIVTIVAGGPQYRVGLGRQLVLLSRFAAERGYPTLRFDYQGMGDSEGETKQFTDIEDEIAAAVAQLKRSVPEVTDVVLWGGCNAASAIMMFASEIPEVTAYAVNNPYIESDMAENKAVKAHYQNRLKDVNFWKKFFGGKYFNYSMLKEIFSVASAGLKISRRSENENNKKIMTFTERMLQGFSHFSGKALVIVSGKSVDGQKFLMLSKESINWNSAIQRENVTLLHEANADHGFSKANAQKKLFSTFMDWLDACFIE